MNVDVKRNLCVRTRTQRDPNDRHRDQSGFIRCKTIAPVRTVADAEKLARSIHSKIHTTVSVSVRVTSKGREHKGRRYYFKRVHGMIECFVGSEWGRPCKR